MDADELRKTLKRLDAMSERCDYVISRNRPLTLDEPPRPNGRKACAGSTRKSPGYARFAVSRSSLPASSLATRCGSATARGRSDRDDCDPDGMWANFESEFDDMVAGMH